MSKEWFNNVQFFLSAFSVFIPQGKIMILTCKYNLLGSKNGKTMEIIATPFSKNLYCYLLSIMIFFLLCVQHISGGAW